MPEAEMEYLHHSYQKYHTIANNYNHCFPLILASSAITPIAALSFIVAYTFIQKKWSFYMEQNIDLWYKIKEDKLSISREYSDKNVLAIVNSSNIQQNNQKNELQEQIDSILEEEKQAVSQVEAWHDELQKNKEKVNLYDRCEKKAFGMLMLMSFFNFAYVFKTKTMFETTSIAAITK